MSKYDGEQILVVPRSLFDELGSFQGLSTDTERYIPSLLNPSMLVCNRTWGKRVIFFSER